MRSQRAADTPMHRSGALPTRCSFKAKGCGSASARPPTLMTTPSLWPNGFDWFTELKAESNNGSDDLSTNRSAHPLSEEPVSYTHLRAHETGRNLVCRLL